MARADGAQLLFDRAARRRAARARLVRLDEAIGRAEAGDPQPLRELLGRARQGHDSISAICRRIGERCAELTYAEHGIAHAPRESEEFALRS